MVTIFPQTVREQALAIGQLLYENPFSTARITLERQALGAGFIDEGPL